MGNTIEGNESYCWQLRLPSHHFQGSLWRGELLHRSPRSWTRPGHGSVERPPEIRLSRNWTNSNPSSMRIGQFEFRARDAESGDEVRGTGRRRAIFGRREFQTKAVCDP